MKKITALLLSVVSISVYAQNFGFSEEFSNNDYAWAESYDESSIVVKVEDGFYKVEGKQEGSTYWPYHTISLLDVGDFSIETKLNQYKGKGKSSYGLAWGGDGSMEGFYVFKLNAKQSFSISYRTVEDEDYLVKWTDNDAINKSGKDNVLKVNRVGDKLEFYINDAKVHEADYDEMRLRGQAMGFYVEDDVHYKVDYLRVSQKDLKINLPENYNKASFKKSLMSKNINSEYEELNPKISVDGKTLYFSRTGHPENKGIRSLDDDQDIWVSYFRNGAWTKAENIGWPINNDSYNHAVSISADNNTLVLGNTYNADGSAKDQGISIATIGRDGKWGVPQDVEIDDYYNNSAYVGYFLSPDNSILLSCIDREDSYGERDVYVSFLKKGKYTKPLNLGPVVNSFVDEISVFLAADNKTMYYSSQGKPGYGSSDIYMSKRLDDSWTNWSVPVNLGPIINTNKMEMFFTLNAQGDKAYVSSFESGGGDLYVVDIPTDYKPESVVLIKGKVLNAKTKEPIQAEIDYVDLSTSEDAGQAISNPIDGGYQIVLPYGKNYAYKAIKEGFYAISANIDLRDVKEYQELEKDLLLAPVEVGEVIRLNNIFFDFNKSSLQEESYHELDRLVELLNEYKKMEIEISGHTDDKGDDNYNLNLSDKRANAVKEYLISKGIKASRLTSKGYGESNPVADNATEEGRSENRRVEFKILKK